MPPCTSSPPEPMGSEGRLSGLALRIKAGGAASRAAFRDRRRAAGRKMRAIGQTLRRRTGQATQEILRLTAEVAGIARATLRQARRVARNASRAVRRIADGRLRRLVHDMAEAIAITERLLEQTAARGRRASPTEGCPWPIPTPVPSAGESRGPKRSSATRSSSQRTSGGSSFPTASTRETPPTSGSSFPPWMR